MNDKLHRDNGLPAVVHANGTKYWFVNGQRHRDNDLPAIEWADGTVEYYVRGIKDAKMWCEDVKLFEWIGQQCVITLEEILPESEVGKCSSCVAIFLFSAISEWLRLSKLCPHCKSRWTNYVKYK